MTHLDTSNTNYGQKKGLSQIIRYKNLLALGHLLQILHQFQHGLDTHVKPKRMLQSQSNSYLVYVGAFLALFSFIFTTIDLYKHKTHFKGASIKTHHVLTL